MIIVNVVQDKHASVSLSCRVYQINVIEIVLLVGKEVLLVSCVQNSSPCL